MAREEKRNIKKAYKKALAAERRMGRLDDKVINAIKRDIKASTLAGTHNYTPTLEKKILTSYGAAKAETLLIQDKLQDSVTSLAVRTIADAARIKISTKTIRSIIKNVNIDRFSKVMRPSFNEYKGDLLFHLKKSIGFGKGVEKLAKELTTLDPVTLNVPKHINDIVAAARRAVRDPKDFIIFEKTLKKHRHYIDNLTRAGEEGFEHLGIRRASRAFLRDIKKAVNDNTIDNVVDKWAKRKLNYIQKRVARTETSRAYMDNIFGYGIEADHIKGVIVKLSPSHPAADICDELAGTYIFGKYSDEWSIPRPPHHPQCICDMEYLFYEDFLNDPDEFVEAA